MQDKFYKGLYKFFSVAFIVSFLMMQAGGCKINKNTADVPVDQTTTITSTFNPETDGTTEIDKCDEKEKLTTSDTDDSSDTGIVKEDVGSAKEVPAMKTKK